MKIRVLGRDVVAKLLKVDNVIEGVTDVYKLKAQGKTSVWPLVSHDFESAGGMMDIRSGYVGGKELHGIKMLNNFPNNMKQGLPPFNGMLLIFDSTTGLPLGVLDASYITCMRTGAAGAIGAKALARQNSENLFILGAGKQSAYLIASTLVTMPGIKKVYVSDPVAPENAKKFVEEMPERLISEFYINDRQNVLFEAAEDLEKAVSDSDIIITATPSRTPVIKKEWVKKGTHFSCIGSDMEGKEEIDPEIFKGAKVFTDDKKQCMRVGEIEIPLAKGIISESEICGELGELLCGKIEGRKTEDEITIFDATGLALLDLVTGKYAIDQAENFDLGIQADI